MQDISGIPNADPIVERELKEAGIPVVHWPFYSIGKIRTSCTGALYQNYGGVPEEYELEYEFYRVSTSWGFVEPGKSQEITSQSELNSIAKRLKELNPVPGNFAHDIYQASLCMFFDSGAKIKARLESESPDILADPVTLPIIYKTIGNLANRTTNGTGVAFCIVSHMRSQILSRPKSKRTKMADYLAELFVPVQLPNLPEVLIGDDEDYADIISEARSMLFYLLEEDDELELNSLAIVYAEHNAYYPQMVSR